MPIAWRFLDILGSANSLIRTGSLGSTSSVYRYKSNILTSTFLVLLPTFRYLEFSEDIYSKVKDRMVTIKGISSSRDRVRDRVISIDISNRALLINSG